MLVMRLAQLAADVPGAVLRTGADYEVSAVTADSRLAGPGRLFVAVPGARVDGHRFAAEAAHAGAAVALMNDVELPPSTPAVVLPDTRTGLAELAAAFHGRPARKLLVAGVTGTDGKTTVTHLAAWLLQQAGRPCGELSTVALSTGRGDSEPNLSGQTTMDAPAIQSWLARMVAEGATHAVLEVTSHALVQHRIGACDFDVAAYTNVGRDHLDYHASWEEYLEAKARLVGLCNGSARKGVPKTAVLNRDDVSFERLAELPIERRTTYSIDGQADLRASELAPDGAGTCSTFYIGGESARVRVPLPARYNVGNALCASGIALAFGLSLEEISRGLATFPGLAGRLEKVALGQPFEVVIDFAHAAGALATTLSELRPHVKGRLLLVFGSTGRADHDRAGMGRAAAEGADWFVITTDDPVTEDPARISAEVAAGAGGAEGATYEILLDRRQAIRRAMEEARPGDLVLLAGKGHERAMITAAGKEPWDERAEPALRALGYG
jgi:UDP-N-acetylmuramoyl-L-alanyl-D-glutamate--2,6-diaminopimelate ligase